VSYEHDPLRRSPLFSDLTLGDRRCVVELGSVRALQRGEILALEGDPTRWVYVILEGRVRAIKLSAGGREQVVAELSTGEVLYGVPALDNGPLPATTQAATRARVLALPAEAFREILLSFPNVAMRLLEAWAERLRRMTGLVEDLSLRSVSARLASLLLDRATGSVDHRMTQREMAARLGTVREVVSRTLGEFQDSGWIVVHRGRIEILDTDALRCVAQTDG